MDLGVLEGQTKGGYFSDYIFDPSVNQCTVPASQGTVVCSVMVVPPVPMGGTSYRAPAGPMASPVMGRGSMPVPMEVDALVHGSFV